jgi:putative addiction module component (TIGR02574 family)
MAISVSDLLSLSMTERLQLVEDLWDSIAAEAAEIPLTEEQRREIDLRLAEHDRNPASALPWEDVRMRLLRRFA